jgi:N-acetylglucosamine-6-phosphate deacetylase
VIVLCNARVVTPEGIIDNGWVAVEQGRIEAFGSADPPGAGSAVWVDLGSSWLLPGFVDLHMHGGGGHDVSASAADLAAAVDFHRSHGTTRTLVSLVAAPLDALAEQLGWIADITAADPTGGVFGAHLEGPFLAHERCGAQNRAHLCLPDRSALAGLIDAARGTLRSVTIAPELPGALALIGDALAAGAVAAIGHTDADYAQARAAIDAGATLATHLFNGMRPLHHRDPGVIGAALGSDLACEIINDGVHVHPAITALVARVPGRLILVTDAIEAAGIGDGHFVLGGQDVQVRDGEARLTESGSLAGSMLTMDEAVRRAVLDCGLSVATASAAASGNPARVIGLGDRCGAIAAGLDADLVVMDGELRVQRVMTAGRWHEPAFI